MTLHHYLSIRQSPLLNHFASSLSNSLFTSLQTQKLNREDSQRTSTDREVLLLIDYVLGSGESDTTEMSLRVVIREVMHRLNDVTEHKKKSVVNVTSNWISPAELLMMKSSGSSTSSSRCEATLTSVSANVNPYKESSLRDTPTSNLSRVDQLIKSVILTSYFRDPTLNEHLLISALIKE